MVELSEADTILMRRCILPVLSHGSAETPYVHGTCSVIATFGRHALAISATHVLDEVVTLDGSANHQFHIPEVLRPPRPPIDLRHRHIGSVYQLSKGEYCSVRHLRAWLSETHDISISLVQMGDDAPAEATFDVRMAVSFEPRKVGQVVQIGGYSQLATAHNPSISALVLPMDIELHLAKIVAVHLPHRPGRKVAGPVYEVDVECPHGTSGGPMIVHDDKTGEAILSGVVSSASNFDGPRTYAGMLYPILGLSLPGLTDNSKLTVLDLVKDGLLDDRSGAATRGVVTPLPNGQFAVGCRA